MMKSIILKNKNIKQEKKTRKKIKKKLYKRPGKKYFSPIEDFTKNEYIY